MALQPPDSLSPSRMALFQQCPLRFKFETLEKRPTTTGRAAVLGTCVHRALELLYTLPADQRSLDALVDGCLPEAIRESRESDDFVTLGLDEADSAKFAAEAGQLSRAALAMEDPRAVDVVSTEQRLEASIDGVILRGIVDRIDRDGDRLVVVDWKSGRAPSVKFQAKALGQLDAYAILTEENYGDLPAEVRLMYMKERVEITAYPTERKAKAFKSKFRAVIGAVERACERDDFRPNPSKLCDWCDFKPICPAHMT